MRVFCLMFMRAILVEAVSLIGHDLICAFSFLKWFGVHCPEQALIG